MYVFIHNNTRVVYVYIEIYMHVSVLCICVYLYIHLYMYVCVKYVCVRIYVYLTYHEA